MAPSNIGGAARDYATGTLMTPQAKTVATHQGPSLRQLTSLAALPNWLFEALVGVVVGLG